MALEVNGVGVGDGLVDRIPQLASLTSEFDLRQNSTALVDKWRVALAVAFTAIKARGI